MKKLLVICTLFFSQALLATITPHPCAIGLQGEFLYWKPSVGDTYFFQTTLTEPHQFLNASTSFHPAFRLSANFAVDWANVLEARFTRLSSSDTTIVTQVGSDFITSLFLDVGMDSSEIKVTYYAGDFTWKNYQSQNPRFNFSFFEGLHFAWLDSINQITGVAASGSASATISSLFWGLGPEIGVDLRWTIPYYLNLSVIGNFRGSLLASKISSKFYNLTPSNITNDAIFKDDWQVSPAFDGRIGFDWERNGKYLQTHLEIGYEMAWYSAAVQFANIFTVNFPRNDVCFHGPYASIGLVY